MIAGPGMAETYWAEISPEEALVALQVRITNMRKGVPITCSALVSTRRWVCCACVCVLCVLPSNIQRQGALESEELTHLEAYLAKQMQRPMREKDRLYHQFFTPVCACSLHFTSNTCVRVCVHACMCVSVYVLMGPRSTRVFDHSYVKEHMHNEQVMVCRCME